MFELIKKAAPADVDFIKRIEIESGLSSWTKEDYNSEITRDDSIFFVALENEEVIGFIMARLIMNKNSISPENEIEIYNLAVDKSFRQRKIGSRLLTKVIESATENNIAKIHLEVRKSNLIALDFYRKNGFEMIGERRNFYRNPTEDAVLMCRFLTSGKNV
jgi:[ribosomal protein S18]-alanine N-acetyltransferase